MSLVLSLLRMPFWLLRKLLVLVVWTLPLVIAVLVGYVVVPALSRADDFSRALQNPELVAQLVGMGMDSEMLWAGGAGSAVMTQGRAVLASVTRGYAVDTGYDIGWKADPVTLDILKHPCPQRSAVVEAGCSAGKPYLVVLADEAQPGRTNRELRALASDPETFKPQMPYVVRHIYSLNQRNGTAPHVMTSRPQEFWRVPHIGGDVRLQDSEAELRALMPKQVAQVNCASSAASGEDPVAPQDWPIQGLPTAQLTRSTVDGAASVTLQTKLPLAQLGAARRALAELEPWAASRGRLAHVKVATQGVDARTRLQWVRPDGGTHELALTQQRDEVTLALQWTAAR